MNCKPVGRWRIVEADSGSIEIEFAYHKGDEAVLKAKRVLLQQPARPDKEMACRQRLMIARTAVP